MALASVIFLPGWAALVCVTAIAGLVAVGLPRWRLPLGMIAVASVIAIPVVLSISGHRSSPSVLVTQQWDRWPTDLASATDPSGFFPARPALRCNGPATCGTGGVPILNALVFGSGGFPQGIPDERRFLDAQVVRDPPVHLIDDLEPMHDPLRVSPGDTIAISGIIDNAGPPGTASATAREVRALIALPNGSGKDQSVLGEVSALNSNPSAVSDSVTLKSTVPIYLRYEPGTASITREGSPSYRLSDRLVTFYDPDHLDRRELAGHGVRVGCHGPNGVVPAGRSCALRYQALFDVRYAAVPEDVNGIGGILTPDFEIGDPRGIVRGKDDVTLYWSPHYTAFSYLTVRGGSLVSIDCAVYPGDGSAWYHLPSAVNIGTRTIHGYDTAFIPGRDIVHLRNDPPDCTQ